MREEVSIHRARDMSLILSLVHHNTVTLSQILCFGDFANDVHQMANVGWVLHLLCHLG